MNVATPITVEAIRPLWHADLPIREIAVRLGTTVHRVEGAIERFHLPPRRNRIDDARLIELVRAGHTRPAIAALMGENRQTIDSACRRLGLLPKPARDRAPGIDAFDIDTAARMRAEGRSINEIAEHFMVTRHYVQRRLGERPPTPVPIAAPRLDRAPAHPWWTPERDLAVYETKGRHAALSALAATLGRPIAFVQQRWHQLRVIA